MPFAFLLILPMRGAVEEFLVGLKGLARTEVELFIAVLTEYQAGENAAPSTALPAMPLLPDFLHSLEHIHLDDRFMVARKYRPVFLGIIPGFLIPDGIGVGLEIDRAPRVFRHLQNMHDL